MLQKILTWRAVIFVVFYLVTEPAGAGHLITSAVNGLKHAGSSLATSVNSLSLQHACAW